LKKKNLKKNCLLKQLTLLRTMKNNKSWDKDNQAWWDWYVSLADNADSNKKDGLVKIPEPVKIKYPSKDELKEQLSSPFNISKDNIKNFQKNGFIKLKNVLTPYAVQALRNEILSLLTKTFKNYDKSKKNRFLSLEMMWLENALIKEFVLSSRIAKICADLLSVKRIRLYHDNALVKESGCGRTPWHYDDDHFPLATNDVITVWIPAQAIPIEMGPLTFAKPIEAYKLVKDIKFNASDTSYDREISNVFKTKQISVVEEPFELGEVSFHHNLSFHTASGNKTNQSRIVLANTYFADGARVVDNPTMISGDWKKFIPDTHPGEIVSSNLNPICWPVNNQVKV
jgi:ectoine hydroxylase-related dioxygenase (phytanoyl-CoA dioxygenase family)